MTRNYCDVCENELTSNSNHSFVPSKKLNNRQWSYSFGELFINGSKAYLCQECWQKIVSDILNNVKSY